MQMWWPGDQGGPAMANVLLGRANRGGRLPYTSPDQMVANDPAHPERSNRGVDGKATYSEGIFIGYRWFDRQNRAPLFPFGHGLSYSSFQYSKLKTAPASDGGLEVHVTIRNADQLDGDEVVQAYLGPPSQAPAGVQFANQALAAFERIHIKAGQSKTTTLHVPVRQLQYWSVSETKWVTAANGRTLHVGA